MSPEKRMRLGFAKPLLITLAISLFLGISPLLASAETGSVLVFAAASTTNAVADVGKLFGDKNKVRVRFSFASSSTLAKQIENGAPADIYLAANIKWMEYLQAKKSIDPATRIDLLGNRIVMIAPVDSAVEKINIGPGINMAKCLKGGLFAMGDPDHVPAGMYGKQAMQTVGIWPDIKAKVARARDVRAALALVARGEVSLGQVYATDAALFNRVKVVGIFPESSHPSIVYPVAIVTGHLRPLTRNFIAFLQTPAARAVFTKYGFKVH